MTAFGGEKFVQPPRLDQGNSTILRHCFAAESCWPAAIGTRFYKALHVPPSDLDRFFPKAAIATEGSVSAKIADLTELMQTRFAGTKRVKALPDLAHFPFVGTAVFSQTGHWYAWPFSTPANDLLSATLREKILDAAVLAPDEMLIAGKPETHLWHFERDMLARLRSRCRLVLVHETAHHSVYRCR